MGESPARPGSAFLALWGLALTGSGRKECPFNPTV